MIGSYWLNLGMLAGIFLVLTLAAKLVIGELGYLNLAFASLFGIGAYAYSVSGMLGGPWPFMFGAAAASILGGLLSLLTRRQKGPVLALTTVVFSMVLLELVLNTPKLGGAVGLSAPMRYSLLFTWAVAMLAFLLFRRLLNSPFGRLVRAIKCDEGVAFSIGKTKGVRLFVLAFSSAFIGLAGALYAGYLGFISPELFTMHTTLLILSMMAIGGRLETSIVGVVLVLGLSEPLRFITASHSALKQILFSSLIILILIMKKWKPET
jgi:branched-chain amino acid transport system permease protein